MQVTADQIMHLLQTIDDHLSEIHAQVAPEKQIAHRIVHTKTKRMATRLEYCLARERKQLDLSLVCCQGCKIQNRRLAGLLAAAERD